MRESWLPLLKEIMYATDCYSKLLGGGWGGLGNQEPKSTFNCHRFLSQNSRQSPQHPLMPSANRQPELRGSNELCSVARSNHIEVTFCLQKWMKTIFPEMMCDICDFVLGSNVSNSRDAVVFKLYKLQEKYVKKRGKPIEIQ